MLLEVEVIVELVPDVGAVESETDVQVPEVNVSVTAELLALESDRLNESDESKEETEVRLFKIPVLLAITLVMEVGTAVAMKFELEIIEGMVVVGTIVVELLALTLDKIEETCPKAIDE